MSEALVEEDKAGCFGTPDFLCRSCKSFPVKRDEIAKTSRIAGFTGCGPFLAIDPPLNTNRPFL
jgi:hypothetical protein